VGRSVFSPIHWLRSLLRRLHVNLKWLLSQRSLRSLPLFHQQKFARSKLLLLRPSQTMEFSHSLSWPWSAISWTLKLKGTGNGKYCTDWQRDLIIWWAFQSLWRVWWAVDLVLEWPAPVNLTSIRVENQYKLKRSNYAIWRPSTLYDIESWITVDASLTMQGTSFCLR
jgi:hypothetical protein